MTEEKSTYSVIAEIKKQVEKSREHVQDLGNMDAIEENIRRSALERAKQREALDVKQADEELSVYSARKSLQVHSQQKRVEESIFHRLYRFIKGLISIVKKNRSGTLLTCEKKRNAYIDLVWSCWEPYCIAFEDAVDVLWNFICRLGYDAKNLILAIVDAIIALAFYFASAMLWIWDRIWDLRFMLEANKSWLFQVFAGAVSLAALLAVFVSSLIGYEYSYYGKVLGIARNRQDVYQTIDVLGDKLSEATGANISINVERDIEFQRVIGFKLNIDSTDEILNTLTYMKDIQVRAYAIKVDGYELVIMEDEEMANRLLKSIQDDFTPEDENIEYQDIHFEEEVYVEEVGAQLGDIWNFDDAKKYLKTGSVRTSDEVNPFIHVASTEVVTAYEKINYGTRYVSNDELYEDETELISAGRYGERRSISQVEKVNGEVLSKTVLSTVKISNPVDEVRYAGTKPIPARVGTGTFIYPLKSYTLTSRFGQRWGKLHAGIDLAAVTGSKIYASDGGTVVYAGWSDSYGYVVYIDHGSLYESRYAHCSKILVKQGDQIYQGQNIALVGNTGNSTGPHLHFEIRYKGVPYNPLNYL